jgi:hypothetical protein
VAWTRRRAAVAYASASSASLTIASSRAQRAAASMPSGMVTARGREPAADEQVPREMYRQQMNNVVAR